MNLMRRFPLIFTHSATVRCYYGEFDYHSAGVLATPRRLQSVIRHMSSFSENTDTLWHLNHFGGDFPSYELGKNIWYDFDIGNMSDDHGWTMTWRSSNETEWYAPTFLQTVSSDGNVSWLASQITHGEIPYFGVIFHRRVVLCEVTFDVELSDGFKDEAIPGFSIFNGWKGDKAVFRWGRYGTQQNCHFSLSKSTTYFS